MMTRNSRSQVNDTSAMPARSGASSATMNTSTSFSSSWLGSSPSRQSPSRQSPSRQSPHRNGVRSPKGSLIRDLYESPSRQITLEFNHMLNQSDREFHKKLDEDAAKRASLHQEQLAKAAAEHQRVMQEAERELERIKLEEETERLRKKAAQEKELQRLKEQKMKEEAEARQRQLEAKLREEQIAREAAENQKKQQEAAARARAQKEQEEAARRREEDEQKAKEAAAKPPPPVQQTQPTPPAQAPSAPAATATASTTTTTAAAAAAQSASSPPSADIVEVHKKYLALHGSMKQFRKQFQDAHKDKSDPLKPFIGDIRRNMNKRMGQITIDVNDSRAAIKAIRTECFEKALNAGGPMIDIRPYLMSHQIANEADAQYPQLLLYAWICFEKALIHQWYNEASKEDGRIISQLSLIAASLYLDTNFMLNGVIPMTDTLLAKLHRICPMLFGIRGDMGANRAGLGLDKIHNNEADMNRYSQLMTGVGAGYAALTHKKFNGKPPAIPISEYWRTVALICNTPAEALYPGHFLVLQGLLRDNVRKFLMTYGMAAKAVLRRATFDLPNRIPAAQQGTPEARPGLAAAASLVKVLPDVWQKKEKISIK